MIRTSILAFASLVTLTACTVTETTMSQAPGKPEFLNPPEFAAQNRPFSQAVRAGDFLILSGQLGTGADGKLVAGGIVPETKQMMDNIKAVLEKNGASFADVVKCTVFLADMAEWPTFNGVYTTYFTKPFPARSAIGSNGLALQARVELECMAYQPKR